MAWALLLLLGLVRLVLVRLLLRHLQILFLETGSSMTLLLYNVYLSFFFLFGALYSGRTFCRLYRHWLLYIWTVFMVMYLWLCV
jgi:hypothetical protein